MPTSPKNSSGSSTGSGSSSSSDDDNNKQSNKATTKLLQQWLLGELRQELPTLLIGCLAMMVSSASNTMLPRFMGRLLDQQGSGRSSSSSCSSAPSTPSSWSLLLVVIGGGTASFLRTFLLNRAEESVAARIRAKVFESLLLNKSVEWFQVQQQTNSGNESSGSDPSTTTTTKQQQSSQDSNSSASQDSNNSTTTTTTPAVIHTILNDDVTTVAHTLTATTANLVRSTLSCALSTYQMVRLNPQLLGVSVCTVPLIGAAAIQLRKFLKKMSLSKSQLAQSAAAFAHERTTQIALVQMSHKQADEIQHYRKLQDDIYKTALQEALANGCFMGFTFSATSSALFGVVHLGGRAVAQGRMTSGQLTSFATYSFLLGLAASGIVKSLGEVHQNLWVGSAVRVHKLLLVEEENDGQETHDNTTTDINVDVDAIDSISLRHLTFSYKSRPDHAVLRSVSMELKRGSIVALVGKNGSGKTTVASLLAGLLHTPQAGNITLQPQGANYFTVPPITKKQLVQMVPQGAPLLNLSIRANVTYSNPTASQDEMDAALQAANCHDFIAKLPGGLDFIVGLQGCHLSGGQRQRLALARALISNPLLLILDEAGSALDNEGETALAQAVVACRGNGNDNNKRKALLLITHRPASLEVADVVVVLRDGQVVETGSLQELKKNRTSALCSLMPDLLKL